ncbi:ABC transporter ATP-binding protein [Treponema sp. J25]|uniref:ABC transporter ATP-binding protein n=1 Tax=Treponema sp. J25 TaxID=2094121 RepID=UPI001051B1A2|nr:ABC transporter ATP-binding protein [Treponema sp. J25]TCW61328.1 3-dehydroquinate dehydratase [Treponema sp. J25]
MITLQDVSKTYSKNKTKALDSIDLTIPDGCIFGFLGPNGAGKTTTIKLITGALEADEGLISVDGLELPSRALEAKARIGYVPDNPELFSRLKGIEFLNFIADLYKIDRETRRERIEVYTRRFEIADVLAGQIGSYSRGMKQKLMVCASLLSDPSNWILDEPLVGLDPQAAFNLKELMRERARAGKCVFFSTHVMEVAEKLCDRLAIINKGTIVFTGTLDELKDLRGKDGSLESLFLELVESGDESGGSRV